MNQLLPPSLPEEQMRLTAVHALAEKYRYDRPHAEQVARLGLLCFDQLQPLHNFGADERFLLLCASLLHDIGWIGGRSRHHKRAAAFIRQADLPFSPREQQMIALIARYHRKALPGLHHREYAALPVDDQSRVALLASLLRVADGLDNGHRQSVQNLTCTIRPKLIHLQCLVTADVQEEMAAAVKKAQLFSQVFERRFHLACLSTRADSRNAS